MGQGRSELIIPFGFIFDGGNEMSETKNKFLRGTTKMIGEEQEE